MEAANPVMKLDQDDFNCVTTRDKLLSLIAAVLLGMPQSSI